MLRGKAALITGSTSGIGLQILKTLAGEGCNVAMHGLGDKQTLQNMLSDIERTSKVTSLLSEADLRKPAQIRDMVREVHERFGRIDILVNNAGIQHVSPIVDLPDDKWDDIIAVCLSSAFHTTKASLPYMIQQGWGRIINTGSMHALVASPYKSAYNAAKHGIAGLTKTVALEVARQNITCNAICPGYVFTDLVKNQLDDTARARGISRESVINDVLLADQPTKKFVKTEEVAALVLHLCGPYSDSFTGACLSIDGTQQFSWLQVIPSQQVVIAVCYCRGLDCAIVGVPPAGDELERIFPLANPDSVLNRCILKHRVTVIHMNMQCLQLMSVPFNWLQ